MKKSEIALIILIAAVSFGASWFLGNWLFTNPDDEIVEVGFMRQIGGDLTRPSDEFFNAYAKNPTVDVYIGSCGLKEKWDDKTMSCIEDKSEEENPEE